MAKIKYGILLVNEVNKIDENIYENICNILGETAETSDILCTVYDEDIIMDKIISWSDKDAISVILIINYNPSDNDIITVIQEIATDPDILLAKLAVKLERRMKIMCPRVVCNVRDKTIIINLPGPLQNKIVRYKKLIFLLQQTLRIFQRSKERYLYRRLFLKKEKTVAMKRSRTSSSDLSTTDQSENSVEDRNEFPMFSVKAAISKIHAETRKHFSRESNREIVNINDANGRVLCETIFSKYNVPPFRTATKHGYAVFANEGDGLRTIVKTSAQIPLEPGTCVWVKTGAPVPDGATAVVQVRDTVRILRELKSDDTSNTDDTSNSDDIIIDNTKLRIMIKPEINDNIKDVGSEISRGRVIINMYTRIGPAEIGLLAVSGYKEVRVAKRLIIGVLSIGDELEEPGNPLQPGYTYDSNRITLISLLKNKGFESLDFGIVLDKDLPIINKLHEALKKVDLLVTTGSINDKDLMKTILKNFFNAEIHFGNVNVKPGKSTTFATCQFQNEKKYFLCLPGNPISAFITAHLFLLPLVDDAHSNFYSQPVVISTCSKQKYVLHKRPRYVWTTLEWNENENFPRAFNKENHTTNTLLSCEGANALLMLPQQTVDIKTLPEAFVPALLVNRPTNRT